MLKMDTNAIILTRDVVWLNKIYWNYMGMTKKQMYNVEDDTDDEPSIINLIDNS
jgi:hypothetical protein